MRHWWLLGLCGCGCESMRDAYVTGSPRDVVVQVRQAVDDFLTSTTRDACVARLRVRDIRDPHLDGRYNPVTHEIGIDADSEGVDWTVRHELCHAIDMQNGLSSADPEAYRLTPEEHPGVFANLPTEGLAYRCQVGGLPIWLLTETSCPGDDPDPTWGWLRDDLYDVEPTGWLEGGPDWVEMGRLPLPKPHGEFARSCYGLEGDGLRVIQGDELDNRAFAAVDLWTGAAVDFDGAPARSIDNFPTSAPVWTPLGGYALGDVAVVRAVSRFPDMGFTVDLSRTLPDRTRLLVHRAGLWKSSTECWEPLCSFPFGDAIGMAYEDGDTLVWGRWVE